MVRRAKKSAQEDAAMSRGLKKSINAITYAASGALAGLAVCFSESIGALVWVAMIPALLAFMQMLDGDKLSLRAAYGYGLIYFECYFAICFHWFAYMYPMDFTGLDNVSSVLVIITAIFGLSLLQALGAAFIFLAIAAVVRIAPEGILKKYACLLFPPFYTVMELLQTIGWWGVPWGKICIGASYDSALLGAASLFGSYFITFTVAFVNVGIAGAIFRIAKKELPTAKLCAGIAICVFALNITLGTLACGTQRRAFEADEKITVAAVQGNYSSTDTKKYTATEILNTYIELTEQAAAEGATFVLWPESALNFVVHTSGYVCSRIADLAKRCGIYVMVGTLTSESDGKIYNCMFLATPDGEFSETVYYKRHLVPFGEYVPMRAVIEKVLPFLKDVKLLGEDMSPGDETSIYDVKGVGKIGAIICFDSIYESLTRDTVLDGAEFIALGTNDSWFGDSPALRIHNNHARLRAIEAGRSVLRAANTGTSTVITPAGDVLSYTEPFAEDYIVEEISLSSDRTLYSYIGNTFAYLCGAISFAALASAIILRSRKEKRDA